MARDDWICGEGPNGGSCEEEPNPGVSGEPERSLFEPIVYSWLGDSENVETHMSMLYIGDNEVIKIFKNIDLGFVDMHPLEKRKISAINTARIDLDYSSGLDTRVATVVLSEGQYHIIDALLDKSNFLHYKNIVDYILVMRPFNRDYELSNLYMKNKVTEDHARQVANLLADAHVKCDTSDEISDIGFAATMDNFEECFGITSDFIGISISEDDFGLMRSIYD